MAKINSKLIAEENKRAKWQLASAVTEPFHKEAAEMATWRLTKLFLGNQHASYPPSAMRKQLSCGTVVGFFKIRGKIC